ncbi:hypothetical protein AN1V17_22660 [Vallitalea sediminicola]
MKKIISILTISLVLLSSNLCFATEYNLNEADSQFISNDIVVPYGDTFGTHYRMRFSKKIPLKIDGVELEGVYVKPQLMANLYKDRTGKVSVVSIDEVAPGSRNCTITSYTFVEVNNRKHRISIDYKGNTGSTGIEQKMTVKAAQTLVMSGEVGFKSVFGSVSTKAELMASAEEESMVTFTYTLDGSYSDNIEATFYINEEGEAIVSVR